MAQSPPYQRIVDHCEACLARHGDSHLGVDWPNAEDARVRYGVMLDLVTPGGPGETFRLLDFGCGASHLYEYLRATGRKDIEYVGLDLSEAFLNLSRSKFPGNQYLRLDVINTGTDELPGFDYAVMNGVFTERVDLTFDEMFAFLRAAVSAVFAKVRVGLAFNVMSKHVDWEREDLFHLPYDMLAEFLTKELSRHFVVRADYGLYEYTVYLYQDPRR
jgi:SAM-dependent methyltransferase